jgi:hypothetical protein
MTGMASPFSTLCYITYKSNVLTRGAVLLSRFANYQQQYLAAAIWVAIPYTKNRRFDVSEYILSLPSKRKYY